MHWAEWRVPTHGSTARVEPYRRHPGARSLRFEQFDQCPALPARQRTHDFQQPCFVRVGVFERHVPDRQAHVLGLTSARDQPLEADPVMDCQLDQPLQFRQRQAGKPFACRFTADIMMFGQSASAPPTNGEACGVQRPGQPTCEFGMWRSCHVVGSEEVPCGIRRYPDPALMSGIVAQAGRLQANYDVLTNTT